MIAEINGYATGGQTRNSVLKLDIQGRQPNRVFCLNVNSGAFGGLPDKGKIQHKDAGNGAERS